SRKKTRERNDSPGSPLNKNEVLKPQAFEKLAGIKTSTKFRAPKKGANSSAGQCNPAFCKAPFFITRFCRLKPDPFIPASIKAGIE
ncbi:hypothetical protein, partial [Allobaculum mucilyticum]|uniref:hypothetical protein n=1 Tax=Allobaculum mucilyticum TaxID=2834459 RepID=UPI001E484813